jgi:hypothetical protein
MKLSKAVTGLCGVLIMGTLLTTIAKADEWNEKTVVTFSGPVEIPGVHLTGMGVLPAGTYVFKLLDSDSDRHIVQIFNKDQTKVYATILAIPNYRLKATGKTVITFSERPAGEPEALRAWFYPGMNYGQEFVYPKAQATKIAQETNTPVLAADIPAENTEPINAATEPAVVAMKQSPVVAVKPTGQEMQLSEVIVPVPGAATTLPATASLSSTVALAGGFALLGAFALWAFRRGAV